MASPEAEAIQGDSTGSSPPKGVVPLREEHAARAEEEEEEARAAAEAAAMLRGEYCARCVWAHALVERDNDKLGLTREQVKATMLCTFGEEELPRLVKRAAWCASYFPDGAIRSVFRRDDRPTPQQQEEDEWP